MEIFLLIVWGLQMEKWRIGCAYVIQCINEVLHEILVLDMLLIIGST